MIQAITKMENDIKTIKDMSPFLVVNYIRKAIGYDEYLQEIKSKNDNRKAENYEEIIECIQKDAAKYKSVEEWILSIEERRNQVKKSETMPVKGEGIVGQNKKEDAVYVVTMHGAKGLEFENVFLPEVNEGTVPYGKMLSKDEEEEERRIFYVAVTRAKERLELSCVENEREQPSRFLNSFRVIK